MLSTNEYITQLNIEQTLSIDEYVIPIYQRNYAWEAKEIEQLIQDIIDYAAEHKDKNYYIGTLVVASNQNAANAYDTIDGQQRLTTLSILSSVIKNEYQNLQWFKKLNIRFASRQKSMDTLKAVFEGNFADSDYEANIKAAYDICCRELKKKVNEQGVDLNVFVRYFYEYVKLIRVKLPNDIDLNHYFEIMNSRGEQLEKHEILKANLMSFFNSSEKRELYEYCFNLIWEACANMERYVQYGFTTVQRHAIFGKDDWNELMIDSFDDFVSKISSISENAVVTPDYQVENSNLSIDQLIKLPSFELKSSVDDEHPDRFNSVVNFQNFLLHVLKLQTDKEEVALDDKRLLDIFLSFIPSNPIDKEDFSKRFIFNLLKCKFLFDKYIIKREFTANTDRWALKCLRWYSSGNVRNGVKYVNTFGEEKSESFDTVNRRILMLLSMFHVSIPSMSYKYWLYAALRYVYNQTEVEPDKYILYLEHIAKSFVFDYYLAKNEIGYHQIINDNLQPISRNLTELEIGNLTYDNIRNNLVFNFIDYLLWCEKQDSDNKIKRYEFTFRSSVEHYYPQNPINNAIPKIADTYLHSIGNLCLISHDKNSRLNNHIPSSKRDYYIKSDTIDSIKQYLMMKSYDWGIKEIVSHEDEILKLLERHLNSNFNWEVLRISKAREWYKSYKQKDKVLLIRSLMCFGQVEVCTGWTSGMDKYNFYQWDKIENGEAFKKFELFVQEQNPASLLEIINWNLSNNLSLREDSYRYAFVSRPYILEYCKEGNFGWANEGKSVLLIENSKASLHQSCDLYCFCIANNLKQKLEIITYCGRDRLRISLSQNDSGFNLISLDWNSAAFLDVWNNNEGQICYEVNTQLHGNSKVIKNLKDNGWELNQDGKLFHSSKQFLLRLSKDVEDNIQKLETAIESIIKKLNV